MQIVSVVPLLRQRGDRPKVPLIFRPMHLELLLADDLAHVLHECQGGQRDRVTPATTQPISSRVAPEHRKSLRDLRAVTGTTRQVSAPVGFVPLIRGIGQRTFWVDGGPCLVYLAPQSPA